MIYERLDSVKEVADRNQVKKEKIVGVFVSLFLFY